MHEPHISNQSYTMKIVGDDENFKSREREKRQFVEGKSKKNCNEKSHN